MAIFCYRSRIKSKNSITTNKNNIVKAKVPQALSEDIKNTVKSS